MKTIKRDGYIIANIFGIFMLCYVVIDSYKIAKFIDEFFITFQKKSQLLTTNIFDLINFNAVYFGIYYFISKFVT
jgi:hypothetical protein